MKVQQRQVSNLPISVRSPAEWIGQCGSTLDGPVWRDPGWARVKGPWMDRRQPSSEQPGTT